jgi:hypothetical protein
MSDIFSELHEYTIHRSFLLSSSGFLQFFRKFVTYPASAETEYLQVGPTVAKCSANVNNHGLKTKITTTRTTPQTTQHTTANFDVLKVIRIFFLISKINCFPPIGTG